MKYLGNKKILLLGIIPLALLVLGFTFYYSSNRGIGVEFEPGFTETEKAKISNDLEKGYSDAFSQGVTMKIKKQVFPDCEDEPECTQYLVEYRYNQYVDWVPGYLELDNGVYVFQPSI